MLHPGYELRPSTSRGASHPRRAAVGARVVGGFESCVRMEHDGAGMAHGASISDSKLETETERRINKQLADQITKIARSNGVEGWSFAAPPSCHNAIVELVAADVRNRIVEFVKSDLVKVEPAKLGSHFRSLRPI